MPWVATGTVRETVLPAKDIAALGITARASPMVSDKTPLIESQ
jgi:hypothetical protein